VIRLVVIAAARLVRNESPATMRVPRHGPLNQERKNFFQRADRERARGEDSSGGRRRSLSVWLACALALALAGCAHPGGRGGTALRPASAAARGAAASDAASIQLLGEALAALDSSVAAIEAHRVAAGAHEQARQLAREYRVARPALFHNLLVNVGLKKRGLCFHWAEDLSARLQGMNLVTLEVHWAIARAGTAREHNALVVTARAQPFERGVVLDAWRHSGRLHWGRVAADRYPWQEGEWNPAVTPP
jgi:hypothetical protein